MLRRQTGCEGIDICACVQFRIPEEARTEPYRRIGGIMIPSRNSCVGEDELTAKSAKRPPPLRRVPKKLIPDVDGVDVALGHAAFAMVQTMLDELVANGAISPKRMGVLAKLARGRLIAVPSFNAARRLLELEQAERESSLGISH
jgi:hypothetical protein